MASFNRLFLIGNLTRDPELRFTPESNKAVASLTVAVNGRNGDAAKSHANFVRVTVWEKQAEACAAHLKKGSQVHVDGRLRQERWEKDGKKLSRLTVVANSVTFLGKKSEQVAPAGDAAVVAEPEIEESAEEEEEAELAS